MRFDIIMLKVSQVLMVIAVLSLYIGIKKSVIELNEEIAKLKVKIETIDSRIKR